MAGSRRKYKKSRTKVRVGLPKKNPKIVKPAFSVPLKLLESLAEEPKWDDKGTVTQNYSSFGVVNNPNSLTDSLQLPPDSDDLNDSGSDLEEDGLFSSLDSTPHLLNYIPFNIIIHSSNNLLDRLTLRNSNCYYSVVESNLDELFK